MDKLYNGFEYHNADNMTRFTLRIESVWSEHEVSGACALRATLRKTSVEDLGNFMPGNQPLLA